MKQVLLVLLLSTCAYMATAQQLFIEAFSGYNRTAYQELETDQSNYIPLGFRLAGGLEHIQIGGEYRRHITNPSFSFSDDLFKTEYEETYYGALIRGNFSSLPAYRFGLVLKAGAGYYNATERTYQDGALLDGFTIEYDKAFGWNAGIGISAPIAGLVHWEIGYQFNSVKREIPTPVNSPTLNMSYHSLQLGLSLNLVFGNTAKRCRRVISSSGGRR